MPTPTRDWIINSTGLVGFWPGDEMNGATLLDRSSAVHNGTVGTAAKVRGGDVGGQCCPYFNGATGQNGISAGTAAGEVGDVFTLFAFVRVAPGYAGYGTFLNKPANGYQFQFYGVSPFGLIRLNKNGVTDIVHSTVKLNDGTAHAAMVTKNGATVKVYVDGIDRTGSVTNATIANTGGALWLGCDASGGSPALTGSAGLFSVWNRALTAAEAYALGKLAVGN